MGTELERDDNDAAMSRMRSLIAEADVKDDAALRELVDELSQVRETELFREVGKLTRELHEALNAFRFDSRLAELTEQDIPDATERLNYVMALTEQSANRTLTSVEKALPRVEGLSEGTRSLLERWQRFRARQMNADEFRELARDIDAFLPNSADDAEAVRKELSEILIAQDFQDLTGQVIRRVITLVQDLEQHLIRMLRLSGGRLKEPSGESGAEARKSATEGNMGTGPAVPGVGDEDVVQGQDDVDDLLSSLGF